MADAIWNQVWSPSQWNTYTAPAPFTYSAGGSYSIQQLVTNNPELLTPMERLRRYEEDQREQAAREQRLYAGPPPGYAYSATEMRYVRVEGNDFVPEWLEDLELGAAQLEKLGAAQLEEHRRCVEEARRQAGELAEQKIKAAARAQQLLREHLTKEQIEQYDRDSSFIVVGQVSGRRYQLHGAGHVYLLDDGGEKVESYCIHPDPMKHPLPIGDIVLGKVLMLRFDEENFLRTANATRVQARRAA